ncbi:BamA/TamA family outer membrane protein [Paramuribaculum intestinale]|uniref:BamA/TamA family outer membrane protein n=1 Tax=Paramuribaculum intestinale TaxID=2094151 RepID=UPI0025A97617|nr:BamA/TamA family outer membrane protein [Paramuribaculum intestinale]
MTDQFQKILLAVTMLIIPFAGRASDHGDPLQADTVPQRKNIIDRLLDYFAESNKPDYSKGLDVSFIGGPHYASDTKLGIGLVAAGNYLADRSDTSAIPSNVSLYSDISTAGFALLGLRGTHIFPSDRRRIDYNIFFYSFPTEFWGLDFGSQRNDDGKSSYRLLSYRASVTFMWRLGDNLFAGPALEFHHYDARKAQRPELWLGQDMVTNTVGAGFRLQYDSRDSHTGPATGWLFVLDQKFCPRFLSNSYAFSFTALRLARYTPLWRGGVLAAQVAGRFAYGNVCWSMMSNLDEGGGMRSYYEGRYRDKCALNVVAELRQHVWRRSGVTFWAGAGVVTPAVESVRWSRVLPCVGLGYRWEFKKRCNVRLDYGIGRGSSSFSFNINEAF